MSKPLLTDDVIEQAKRGEIDLEEQPYYEDYDQEFYDEDYEAYMCDMDMDEDEYAHLLSDDHYSCPYYRNDNEYAVVRKQM